MPAPSPAPLAIGGLSAQSLAEQFGTPLYVYDAERIEAQYARLAQAFSALDARMLYACKANSNLHILDLLRRAGAGLDAVSLQEVELGLRVAFAPADILYTPNSVPFEEIAAAVALGVKINIDSLPMLERFGQAFGAGTPVYLRLNPHILAGGHGNIQTGHIDSKFGRRMPHLNNHPSAKVIDGEAAA